MTGAATDAEMLAVKRVSSFRVIESFGCWIPVDHLEVFAVVVGVAFYAGRAWRRGSRICRVKSLSLLQFISNLLVAFEAAKVRCAGRDLVALDAV